MIFNNVNVNYLDFVSLLAEVPNEWAKESRSLASSLDKEIEQNKNIMEDFRITSPISFTFIPFSANVFKNSIPFLGLAPLMREILDPPMEGISNSISKADSTKYYT